MSVNLQTIYGLLFARLATDALGSAVRNALGAGASGVISAEKLRSGDTPAPPFVAFREGAVSGEGMEIRIVFATWWVYDAVAQNYRRINGIVPLIEAAYPQLDITGGRVVVSQIGAGITDVALNLLGRPVQLAFYTRG
jgi:hypothetical protein